MTGLNTHQPYPQLQSSTVVKKTVLHTVLIVTLVTIVWKHSLQVKMTIAIMLSSNQQV